MMPPAIAARTIQRVFSGPTIPLANSAPMMKP
jgi:hypothetical protein